MNAFGCQWELIWVCAEAQHASHHILPLVKLMGLLSLAENAAACLWHLQDFAVHWQAFWQPLLYLQWQQQLQFLHYRPLVSAVLHCPVAKH